jgi:DNA-binding response OmpR family regulator
MDNSKTTIVIVDDEPINLDIICAHLEHDDYQLVKANNGEEAWDILQSNPAEFDVIILDRMMPVMDGMQVPGNIKENDLMEQIPVIMQTAKSDNQDIVDGLKAGAYHYLTKPYDGDLLKTIVRSAVNTRYHEKNLVESLREGRRI